MRRFAGRSLRIRARGGVRRSQPVARRALALALAAGSTAGLGREALAGPQGEHVVHGTAAFDRNGAVTTITTSHQAIINYQSFGIGAGETVRFVQPDASSRVLNRIVGPLPTQIDGSLIANGRVYIVNPAGVFVGPQGVVNVGSLYAAAGSISNEDFLAGVDHFTELTGAVENFGSITGSEVHLLGRRVANFGRIVSPDGLVTLSAGEDVLIGEHGGHVFARITGGAGPDAGLEQGGSIEAGAGRVAIGAGDFIGLALYDTQTIRARDIAVRGGSGAEASIAGEIDAAGVPGGRVEITGDTLRVAEASIASTGDVLLEGASQIRVLDLGSGGLEFLVSGGRTVTLRTGADGTIGFDNTANTLRTTGASLDVQGGAGGVDLGRILTNGGGLTISAAPGASLGNVVLHGQTVLGAGGLRIQDALSAAVNASVSAGSASFADLGSLRLGANITAAGDIETGAGFGVTLTSNVLLTSLGGDVRLPGAVDADGAGRLLTVIAGGRAVLGPIGEGGAVGAVDVFANAIEVRGDIVSQGAISLEAATDIAYIGGPGLADGEIDLLAGGSISLLAGQSHLLGADVRADAGGAGSPLVRMLGAIDAADGVAPGSVGLTIEAGAAFAGTAELGVVGGVRELGDVTVRAASTTLRGLTAAGDVLVHAPGSAGRITLLGDIAAGGAVRLDSGSLIVYSSEGTPAGGLTITGEGLVRLTASRHRLMRDVHVASGLVADPVAGEVAVLEMLGAVESTPSRMLTLVSGEKAPAVPGGETEYLGTIELGRPGSAVSVGGLGAWASRTTLRSSVLTGGGDVLFVGDLLLGGVGMAIDTRDATDLDPSDGIRGGDFTVAGDLNGSPNAFGLVVNAGDGSVLLRNVGNTDRLGYLHVQSAGLFEAGHASGAGGVGVVRTRGDFTASVNLLTLAGDVTAGGRIDLQALTTPTPFGPSAGIITYVGDLDINGVGSVRLVADAHDLLGNIAVRSTGTNALLDVLGLVDSALPAEALVPAYTLTLNGGTVRLGTVGSRTDRALLGDVSVGGATLTLLGDVSIGGRLTLAGTSFIGFAGTAADPIELTADSVLIDGRVGGQLVGRLAGQGSLRIDAAQGVEVFADAGGLDAQGLDLFADLDIAARELTLAGVDINGRLTTAVEGATRLIGTLVAADGGIDLRSGAAGYVSVDGASLALHTRDRLISIGGPLHVNGRSVTAEARGGDITLGTVLTSGGGSLALRSRPDSGGPRGTITLGEVGAEASRLGAMTLQASEIDLTGNVWVSGEIALAAAENVGEIRLGSAAGTDAAVLDLSAAELAMLMGGFDRLTIGGTHAVQVNAGDALIAGATSILAGLPSASPSGFATFGGDFRTAGDLHVRAALIQATNEATLHGGGAPVLASAGDLTLDGAVFIDQGVLFTLDAGGDVLVHRLAVGSSRGAIDGPGDLVVLAGGDATLDADVGLLPGFRLGSLDITAGDTIGVTGAVQTVRDQSYTASALLLRNRFDSASGSILVDAETRLVGGGELTAAGDIRFVSGEVLSVGGAHGLTLAAGRDILFSDAVGASGALGALVIRGAENVTFAGGVIAGSVTQEAGSGVTIFQNGVTATGPGGIALTGNAFTFLDGLSSTGGGRVVIDNAGLLTLRGADLGPAQLTGGFFQVGQGSVSLGHSVDTGIRDLAFSGEVTLEAQHALHGQNIFLDGGIVAGVDGLSLTLDAPGVTRLGGRIGHAAHAFETVSLGGGGVTRLMGDITARSTTITDRAVVYGDRRIEGSAEFARVEAAGDRADSLVVTGDAVFNDAVAAAAVRLESLEVGGRTELHGDVFADAARFGTGAGDTTSIDGRILIRSAGAVSFADAVLALSEAAGLTVDGGGTVSFAGVGRPGEELALLRTLNAAAFAGDVHAAGVDVLGAATISGSVAFHGRDVSFAGPIGGAGASLTINASGSTYLGGPVGAGGQLALVRTDAAGSATISGDISAGLVELLDGVVTLRSAGGVLNIHGSEGIVLGPVVDTDRPGLTLVLTTDTALPSSGDLLPPLRVPTITLGGSLGASGNFGSIQINPQGREYIPAVATVVGARGADVLIRSGGDILLGVGEKLTAFGNVTVSAGRDLQIGDVSALGNIELAAGRELVFATRAASVVYGPDGVTLLEDDGVDIVAGGSVSFVSGARPRSLNGLYREVTFTTFDGGADGIAATFAHRQGGTLTEADLLSGDVVLDLRSVGPSVTRLSESLASALPREAALDAVTTGVSITAAQIEQLRQLSVYAVPADAPTRLGTLTGRSMYTDLNRYNEQRFREVTAERLETQAVERVLAMFRERAQPIDPDAVAARLVEAAESYVNAGNGLDLDPAGWNAFIEGEESLADVRQTLNDLQALLGEVSLLGLSQAEESEVRLNLLSRFTKGNEVLPTDIDALLRQRGAGRS